MSRMIRIGLLRLTDAAPVLAGQALGLFEEQGVPVRLSIEPSWANLADKLAVGLLEGAVMLPALAIATALGRRGPAAPLLVPAGISLGGNALTLAPDLAEEIGAGPADPMALGARLRRVLALRRRPPPAIAVVHRCSTHHLLLRYWLAASGIDPDAAIRLTVIPPAEMGAALASRRIEGFCAGAPWGGMAEAAGAGRTVLATGAIWRNHPEKCLALRADWAAEAPQTVHRLLRALLRAGRICDDPAEAPALARLLARADALDLPEAAIRASLPLAGADPDPLRSTFAAHAASFPWRSQALWFLAEMGRAGLLADTPAARAATRALYRPDLHAAAAAAEGLPVPRADTKPEGAQRTNWLLPADPNPIPMRPDAFCDGRVFEYA